MNYIDIHSHIDFKDFDADRKEVLDRMKGNGIATIVVGVDLKTSLAAIKLADEYENVFACIGAHPHDDMTFIFEEKDFEEIVKNPKVVAIGECGLDYYINQKSNLKDEISEGEKERQKFEFIKQIEFAIKYDKPLMLHIRDSGDSSAYRDAFDILEPFLLSRESKKGSRMIFGNIHFFAGSLEWAKKFVDLGFTISFTGVITFARNYDEVIKNIPFDKLHAETDSPFVAPIPYRGKRNEPSYVIEVVKKIAEIRGENFEKVRTQLLDNARKVFNISI